MRNKRYYNNPNRKIKLNQSYISIGILTFIAGYFIYAGIHNSIDRQNVLSPVPQNWQGGYNQSVVVITATPSPTLTPSPTTTPHYHKTPGTPKTSILWQEFIRKAKVYAKKENFPLSVMMAQAAHESGRGTSNFARNRYNFFGICAYTSNPDMACSYESVDDGIMAYINLIKYGKRYAGAWAMKDNPQRMVQAIYDAGYATDKEYVQKVTSVPEFTNYQ